MRLNEKGSILAYVLVATMVMMIMCASMARMMLFRMTLGHRQADSIGGKQQDQAAVALLSGGWTVNGKPLTCSSTGGYTCVVTVGVIPTCGCYCYPSAAGLGSPGAPPYPNNTPGNCLAGSTPGTSPPGAVVASAGPGGACQLQVYSCP